MWGILAAIFGAIVGFGAGAVGLDKIGPGKTAPVQTHTIQACYNPDLTNQISLRWPSPNSNFTDVPDYRATLNSRDWSGQPTTFDTNADCKTTVMNNQTERTFILVRPNVRIPSCKTDELAGPGSANDKPKCPGAENPRHRGSCTTTGYTELRKIAQATRGSEDLEIFWTPFTHNVGCGYQKENANCGVGDRTNLNLRDFIYALKGRDAYPPDYKYNSCPVRWDSGATEGEACSHYFDVYMAKDLYDDCIAAPASDDQNDRCYFFKQVIQNCREQTVFIPAPEANFTMPPLFISKPFKAETDTATYETGKIIPGTAEELYNYPLYVWGAVGGTVINPYTTNLLKPQNAGEIAGPFSLCGANPTPTPVPTTSLPDCLDALGTINFKDEQGTIVGFKVYSKRTTPETFTLIRIGDDTKGYKYTITEKDYPSPTGKSSSLQLRKLEMISQNQWTWATPSCKPAVYFYPESPTELNVKVKIDGQLTISDPTYDSQNGWQIKAYPEGTIEARSKKQEARNYPYLYYEAELNNVDLPKEGWVVEVSSIKYQVLSIMREIGFNEKEIADFLSYWLPRLREKPYYFVSLLPEKLVNEKEKLNFSVEPDTLIRTRFVFEGLDYPLTVAPINIPKHERNGFVVTDWGGTLVGKSCADIVVK